jgi:predicted nuclease of predicted toxin-antitoxin system
MTIWIDAQLSPAIATWITSNFAVTAKALRDLGLRDAEDKDIFTAAKSVDVIVMTKDADFPKLLETFGSPPKIIWLTCGNTSNKNLKTILLSTLKSALDLLESGESLVEISGT